MDFKNIKKSSIILIILVNLILVPFYLIFYMLCLFLAFIPIFSTKVAKENLKNRISISGLRARFWIANMYMHYIFYFFELIVFVPLKIMTSKNKSEFGEFVDDFRKRNPRWKDHGILYLATHQGNLEFYHDIISYEYKLYEEVRKYYSYARISKISAVTKFLDWYRGLFCSDILWTTRDLLKMLERMPEEKSSLILFNDQKPSQNGNFVPFFGKPAAFPGSGLKVALRANMIVMYLTQTRIVPGLCIFDFRWGKNLHLDKSEKKENSSKTELDGWVFEELKEYVQWLEFNIRKHPSQWCWDYKKWSREEKSNDFSSSNSPGSATSATTSSIPSRLK